MGFFLSDLLGTLSNTFKIGKSKATLDASGLTAARTIALPDKAGTVAMTSDTREMLTAARTYYVRTDGSDSNTGLADTAGGAFLTIQKAVDVCVELDPALNQLTVQIADGTYTGVVVLAPMNGTLPLIIRGNNATPANVHVNVTGTAFLSTQAATYAQILDMKITASVLCLNANPYGTIEYGNVVFGTAGARHISSQYHGHINVIGDYSIVGGAPSHIQIDNGGTMRLVGRTITITGTPTFSTAFLAAAGGSVVSIISNTWSGSATGSRYVVTRNSTVDSAGATLPGDSAGTTATGGQYI